MSLQAVDKTTGNLTPIAGRESVPIDDTTTTTTNVWSASKTNTAINSKTEIDDTSTANNKTWSASKVNSELSSKASIDDTTVTNNKVWSSSKIDKGLDARDLVGTKNLINLSKTDISKAQSKCERVNNGVRVYNTQAGTWVFIRFNQDLKENTDYIIISDVTITSGSAEISVSDGSSNITQLEITESGVVTLPFNTGTISSGIQIKLYSALGTSVSGDILYDDLMLCLADSYNPNDTYVPPIYTNEEISNAIDNTQNGLLAKNLLCIPNSISDKNGLTFSINSDGIITINGTASADTSITLYTMDGSEPYIGKGVILSGTPLVNNPSNNIGLTAYLVGTQDGSGGSYYNYGVPQFFKWLNDGSGTKAEIRLSVKKDTVCSDTLVKPMLRYAYIQDDTYVPYTKTNLELTNSSKVTTKAVDLTNWVEDTTSQSGTTLYKKTITLSHIYSDNPTVEIGAASGSVLPTSAEQDSYNLINYVTVDSTVPQTY